MRHRIPDNEAGERRRETTMASIQERLKRLENQGRFLQWLQFERFLEGLTDAQLEAYTRQGRLPQPLPEPLPKGASRLDVLDRKSLIKLWEENERILGHRSHDDLKFYNENGYWPEQRMRPHHSVQDGHWVIEWQIQPDTEDRRKKD